MTSIEDNTTIDFVVECPHCKDPILIEKINCAIFRHATLKSNGIRIDPHTSKELCDFYFEKKQILGCGKPFKIIKNSESKSSDDTLIAFICEYV